MSRWCPGRVPVVSRWCPCGVPVVSRCPSRGYPGGVSKRIRITRRKTVQKSKSWFVLKSNHVMESNVFFWNLCESKWKSKCMRMSVHVCAWCPEEGSHHERKNNAEIKILNHFEIKSPNGIKCVFWNLCESKWNSRCVQVCARACVCAW